MSKYDKIIFNTDSETKAEFKKCCKEMGHKMSDILNVAIINYINQSKQKPTK